MKDAYDADTPENFASNICRYGGIANTTIQLGTIENVFPAKKSKLNNIIEDIHKYHEFLFEDQGVRVWKLPGFG